MLVCVRILRGMKARRRSFLKKKQTQNVPRTTEKVQKPQILKTFNLFSKEKEDKLSK